MIELVFNHMKSRPFKTMSLCIGIVLFSFSTYFCWNVLTYLLSSFEGSVFDWVASTVYVIGCTVVFVLISSIISHMFFGFERFVGYKKFKNFATIYDFELFKRELNQCRKSLDCEDTSVFLESIGNFDSNGFMLNRLKNMDFFYKSDEDIRKQTQGYVHYKDSHLLNKDFYLNEVVSETISNFCKEKTIENKQIKKDYKEKYSKIIELKSDTLVLREKVLAKKEARKSINADMDKLKTHQEKSGENHAKEIQELKDKKEKYKNDLQEMIKLIIASIRSVEILEMDLYKMVELDQSEKELPKGIKEKKSISSHYSLEEEEAEAIRKVKNSIMSIGDEKAAREKTKTLFSNH